MPARKRFPGAAMGVAVSLATVIVAFVYTFEIAVEPDMHGWSVVMLMFFLPISGMILLPAVIAAAIVRTKTALHPLLIGLIGAAMATVLACLVVKDVGGQFREGSSGETWSAFVGLMFVAGGLGSLVASYVRGGDVADRSPDFQDRRFHIGKKSPPPD